MPHATNYSSPGFTLDGFFSLTGAFSRILQTCDEQRLSVAVGGVRPVVGISYIILDDFTIASPKTSS